MTELHSENINTDNTENTDNTDTENTDTESNPELNSNNISVVGVGKLGLCLALCLEKVGFNVLGMDIFPDYVDKKKIVVTMEKMALQLMLFAGDITKYGLARAMSKANDQKDQ